MTQSGCSSPIALWIVFFQSPSKISCKPYIYFLSIRNKIDVIHIIILTLKNKSRKVLGSSGRKAVYTPKSFFLHAASLDQGFPHCPIFSTAASRRSRPRISMTLLGNMLSHPLPVIALVGHYPTNKLIGRRPIFEQNPKRKPLPSTIR